MQANTVTIDGSPYRIFSDPNQVLYPAAPIPEYALRRVFGMVVNTPKIVDFTDLQGDWEIVSLFISSPIDSEVQVEMIDQNGVVFFSDLHLRNTVPKFIPTVLIDNTMTMRLTAGRSPINLLLLYLKPAYLSYSKDF